ncbi:hypothetical protein FEF65_12255 [Mariprofundus erugo]|uniref:Uncharacterized protein n=1 Tax=Mariprofundus erugo TaxID=2528639 RepID=A0A5R9GIR1_9PROT|nr:hypothetical protein [Mariprofundus erugo]TLS65738.1 hypothetical protein FEF65_12255 [Mariprofundus erugo]
MAKKRFTSDDIVVVVGIAVIFAMMFIEQDECSLEYRSLEDCTNEWPGNQCIQYQGMYYGPPVDHCESAVGGSRGYQGNAESKSKSTGVKRGGFGRSGRGGS